MLYTVENLKKRYDDRIVLDIPRLQIEPEKIYALLGPNGAGKSTLLNILAFLDRPSSGSVAFRSQAVRFTEPGLQALRKEVVMVEQHPILFTTSVYKNMEFGLRIRKIPAGKRRLIIEENLELVGMKSFVKARAHRLSGGETQRIALARALALSPTVLLCDEPTSSVDVENQAIIIRTLKQINEQKKITVLFTSHDSSQVASLADRTLVLSHGRLVPEDTC